jgi:hypothetical protein
MPFEGEPSRMTGTGDFVRLLDDGDFRHIRETVVPFVTELLNELQEHQVRTVPERVDARVIAIAVDAGNQVAFEAIPEMAVGLIRVSASSRDIKPDHLPSDYPYMLRGRELFPVPRPEDRTQAIRVAQRMAETYLGEIWSEPILAEFQAATGITLTNFGVAYQKDFPTFVSSIRDLIEWAYAVKLTEQYERESAATIIVRDGSLEQHGVNSEFREKLLRYFQGRKTPICGFIKGSKLLSRKQGISCWVIGDWVSKRDLPCFFRVPDKLMRHVYDHEKYWNPDWQTDSSSSFMMGHRFVVKMYGKTLRALDAVSCVDIPIHISADDARVREIIGAIIRSRSVLFGGSFGPSMRAHEQASIAAVLRKSVEQFIRQKAGANIPDLE